jgi:hypothetical protein
MEYWSNGVMENMVKIKGLDVRFLFLPELRISSNSI